MPDVVRLEQFLLIATRMLGFSLIAPVFSIRQIPVQVRVGLGVLLAALLLPVLSLDPAVVPQHWLLYISLVVKEMAIGLLIGFTAAVVFNSIRTAGEIIDLQTGLSMANLFDPQTGTSTSLLGQFLTVLGTLIFLQLDGHHMLLAALADSYRLIPLGAGSFGGLVTAALVHVFVGMFALALRLAAPVLAVLLISEVALALVARTVPQLNVFILGFPLKIGLSIGFLALLAPVMATLFSGVLKQMETDLITVMQALGGM